MVSYFKLFFIFYYIYGKIQINLKRKKFRKDEILMKDIKVKDIIEICKGKLICGDENIICENFSNDTRTIKENDVYVGIKGENFDGNSLYKQAFEKGASVCILQNNEVEAVEGKAIIIVEDTIKAIQEIAKYKRSFYDIPVVAVTGSVGKTSTKDIIASVMSKKYNVLKTEGNLNNHIGLPMTILKLKNHTAMVVEMGMNNFGEIRVLTNIAKPTTAVITNIGTSHIGNLGSRENILKSKLEILEGMKENSTIVINNDNDLLHNWYNENKQKYNIVTCGTNNQSDVMAKDIKIMEDGTTFNYNNYKVKVPVPGEHFVTNSLIAIGVGITNSIDVDNIIKGIEDFKLTKKRMDVSKNKNGVTIINDSYNASYDSMKASIEVLSKMKGNKKIAVLGNMFELGKYEKELHEKVGEEVAKNNIDILITVGDTAKYIASKAIDNGMDEKCVYKFDLKQDAIEKIKQIAKENDIVLVKASNGMKFDEIVEKILN